MTSAPLRRAAFAAAAALLAGLPAPRVAAEPPRTVSLFIQAPAAGAAADAGCMGTALLTEPSGWSLGDAAAVVVADHEGRDAARDRLTGAMLAEGAAVLELGTGGLCGGAAGPVAALFGALRVLRWEAGAGLVVAIGHGAGGELALSAVSEEEAAAHLGSSSRDRYAAAASFGAGRAAYAPGQAPAREEAWPLRAGLLCEVLARASAPEGVGEEGPRGATAHDCVTALVPLGEDGRGRAVAAVARRR